MVDKNGTTIVIGDKVLVECQIVDAQRGSNTIEVKPPNKPNGTANTNVIVDGVLVVKGTLP